LPLSRALEVGVDGAVERALIAGRERLDLLDAPENAALAAVADSPEWNPSLLVLNKLSVDRTLPENCPMVPTLADTAAICWG
jgi:hypothetical protein